MSDTHNADAWGLPRVLDYFETARRNTDAVYPSEWFFLQNLLKEGMTVLDIGCAQGGFADVLGEHLKSYDYTGIDINDEMISRARAKHPQQVFHHVTDTDYAILEGRRYNLVLVLGILHLHETWRDTLSAGWAHTAGHLLFDLRETPGPTIEDKSVSKFRMDFHGGGSTHSETILPYNVINASDALNAVTAMCPEASALSHYGYIHPVSHAADCPYQSVMANTYCVEL